MNEIRAILLVEDNPNDIELTLAALEEMKLADRVVVVHDGAGALDYLHCRGRYSGRSLGSPVVVLLDLKMPGLDGLEVLRAIREDGVLRLIPIVMLTGSREECDVVESYRLGVNAYVVKPVDAPQFARAVSGLGEFWAGINRVPQPRSAL